MVLWSAFGMVYTPGEGRGGGEKKGAPPLYCLQNGWPPKGHGCVHRRWQFCKHEV